MGSISKEQKRVYDLQYRAEHRDKLNAGRRERHYANGVLPMIKNHSCTVFLGVHIAEQVLSEAFKNVVRAPYGNPGYDFTCANGYMVDVKSSCKRPQKRGSDRWQFQIKRNTIADYFLCIAFDNRKDLNPEHVWLIPGGDVSHLMTTGVSVGTLGDWAQYEKPISGVVACCNSMKGV